jgi:hypothetical protein
MSARALVLVALAALGCGDRRLDLSLALASDSCTNAVPAGGSILYQINSDDGSRALCGGCLAVTTQLSNSSDILAFLRQNAPSCANIAPNGSMRVALTAYSGAGCSDSPKIFCSDSAPVPLPDGRSDALVAVVLTCQAGCTGVCKPTTCAALGLDCDPVSDGCNGTLNCGTCTPPLRCGGHMGSGGTPNVCSK